MSVMQALDPYKYTRAAARVTLNAVLQAFGLVQVVETGDKVLISS